MRILRRPRTAREAATADIAGSIVRMNPMKVPMSTPESSMLEPLRSPQQHLPSGTAGLPRRQLTSRFPVRAVEKARKTLGRTEAQWLDGAW